MSYIKFSLLNLLIFFTFGLSVHAENNDAALIKAMQDGGHILMIRHAKAPGFGDPDNIKIEDCSTQRNLDVNGRQQSVNIGNWLRNNKIDISDIYSSQWCRCLETARLLNVGSVKELPALNSFFQMTENRELSLSALKQFIAAQATNKQLIIMVTHHVTIAAISGQNVASGDGVLLKLNVSAPFEFVSIFNPE